jgi:nucleotide-binding universal stress UspA family protein
LLYFVQLSMNGMSTILAVTDLSSASYKLVGFASFIAGPSDGEVILVSVYGGDDADRRSEPPPGLRGHPESWRQLVEARLRQEGQLLERQRQWCADRGIRCRAELHEDGRWPDFVLQSARRFRVDLILVGLQLVGAHKQISATDLRRLAEEAPCPVSMVALPQFSRFERVGRPSA